MPVRLPTLVELRSIADHFNLGLSDEDLASFQGLMVPWLNSYSVVERMVEPTLLPVKYPRTPGYRPDASENPYNAWYWKSQIEGAPEGPLRGKRIVVKDNVCVAGVPMMNGSATLEGYVPDIDATIVTRILDAGGTIVGKAVCEDLCVSGGSHTAATGPVLNPRNPAHSAGGSSAGSAALVAAGEVDLAIGGDQGGSIRMPSGWCGVVGLKPTHGLVPYSGVSSIEHTLDVTGPIGANVRDVAVLLEVLAGTDGLDPRQPTTLPDVAYSEEVGAGIEGLRVGVVAEGFDWPGLSEPEVDDAVRQAAYSLKKAGATVVDVSIPLHRQAIDIWTTVAVEGSTELMIKGASMGTNWRGYYATTLLDAYAKGLKTRARNLSETVKLIMMLGEYLHREYDGRYYAKGQNVAFNLRAAYDQALSECDVLVMPTLPMLPTLIPAPTASREEYVARALEMLPNTAAFCISGHPAATVPCQPEGSLPVGMMIIGRPFEDSIVLRAAAAFEDLVGGFS